MKRWFFAFLLLLVPAMAHAEWHEASSEHFIVYSDSSEENIHRFSEQLERFHAAMSYATGWKTLPPSPSSRVTVYVVGGVSQLRELYGAGSKNVGGFYRPYAGGSIAIIPPVRARSGEPAWSMIVLLHEYAHHFMISSFDFPMPRWLSEGAAEFFASASFDRDGSVWLGRVASHRSEELVLGDQITATELLDTDTNQYFSSAHYGKSWLLYHYLSLGPDKERKGQLVSYINGIMQGKSSLAAARDAFGNLTQLELDLRAYQRRRGINALSLKPGLLQVGEIKVRRLSAGEAAMMPVRIRSRVGVNEQQAAEAVAEARKIAASYPDDAAVLSALAEAEYDSGNPEAAIKAADAALAIDKGQVNAYVQKGYALFKIAADTKGADEQQAAYKAATRPFLQLNKLENNHPLPLIYFYQGFVEAGRTPTDNAKAGLEWAAKLAPFDLGLRLSVAQMQIADGRYQDARRNLIPVAYHPHGGKMSEAAQELLSSIEDKKEDRADAHATDTSATAGR